MQTECNLSVTVYSLNNEPTAQQRHITLIKPNWLSGTKFHLKINMHIYGFAVFFKKLKTISY